MRNHRAKVFRETANIDYNATKKLYYYSFKGNLEVANNGIVLTYDVTPASWHAIKSVQTLLSLWPSHQILVDLGYLSRKLKQELAKKKINLWTPIRRNMKQPVAYQRLLNRQRRQSETNFSQLNELFDIE
ncbi:transposase [Lactiplantibacillus plantarum]|uniref:transposase n=1 Tax=Lactiplantibacillus plantarum TaxID=1590 RepID=UPI0009B57B77